MIVIDASALVKYILREQGWEKVERYLLEKRPLYSIDHLLKEVCNAMWKYKVERETVIELYRALNRLIDADVIVLESELSYLKVALEIALKYKVTVYDALYIAQAINRGELLTCDRKQADVALALGVKVHLV